MANEQPYYADIFTLAKSVDFEHSRKVSEISGMIAQKAGFSPFEQAIIKQAALLHDIGKIEVPPEILNKPGPLTPEEFEVVKTHADIGYRKLADAIFMLGIAANVVRNHHERIDGNGYFHLTGDYIHPYARLVSVCDVADALLSKRSYKASWSEADVAAYFREQAGIQFDSNYVAILLDILDEVLKLYPQKP